MVFRRRKRLLSEKQLISKGPWEREEDRDCCTQALAACISPEGNHTYGHGMEDHPLGMSLVRRARSSRGWFCVVLALGAVACSPADPSAHLHQVSDAATCYIPKGRGLQEGNPVNWHPHCSDSWESAAGPTGKFWRAGTSQEKTKDVS